LQKRRKQRGQRPFRVAGPTPTDGVAITLVGNVWGDGVDMGVEDDIGVCWRGGLIADSGLARAAAGDDVAVIVNAGRIPGVGERLDQKCSHLVDALV